MPLWATTESYRMHGLTRTWPVFNKISKEKILLYIINLSLLRNFTQKELFSPVFATLFTGTPLLSVVT